MKYYTVYRIINKITNKYYIGCHETTDINDGYMGSGVYLNRAKKKYGIENFEKEILFVFESREQMFEKERELVTIGENTYNLMIGGHGGWTYARSKITEASYKKVSETMKTDEYLEKTKAQRERSGKRISLLQKDSAIREKQKKSLIKTMNDPEWKRTVGKNRAEKISSTLKEKKREWCTEERNNKIRNSMSGRVCVMLHGQRKRIKKDDPLLSHPDIVIGWF